MLPSNTRDSFRRLNSPAAEAQALTEVLAVVQRAISGFLVGHSGFTVSSGARTSAVTLIQRFGSALNLNPHLHVLFLDGAYTFAGHRPIFHRARRPDHEELNQLLDTLSRRIVRVLERRDLLIAEPAHPSLDLVPDSSLDHLQAASATRNGFTWALLGLPAKPYPRSRLH